MSSSDCQSRMDDRGSKIEKMRSSILNLLSSTGKSPLMIFNDMLRQAPAQNLRRAFGDANTAHLAVPPFERQLTHQSQSAVHLNRTVDDPARHFGAVNLGHIRKLANVFAAVVAPGALVNHQTARMQLHRRVGDHELNRLTIGERPPERGADFGIFDHHIERARSDTDRPRAMAADAPLLDPALRDG